jgi:hypothetical protein
MKAGLSHYDEAVAGAVIGMLVLHFAVFIALY